MKLKRSIFAVIGVAAYTTMVPSTAFAQASVTFSMGSDFDEPDAGDDYYAYDDQYGYDDEGGYFAGGSYDNYYDDGFYDDRYSANGDDDGQDVDN